MAKGKSLSKDALVKAFKVQPRYKIKNLAEVKSS